MRILLDTHAMLWWFDGSPKLTTRARKAIADARNEVFVSLATFWEIAIKVSLGKLALARDLSALAQEISGEGMRLLPIQVEHCAAAMVLPFHHRDPFDRMLVAQAQVEGLDVVSGDTGLDDYPPNRIW